MVIFVNVTISTVIVVLAKYVLVMGNVTVVNARATEAGLDLHVTAAPTTAPVLLMESNVLVM